MYIILYISLKLIFSNFCYLNHSYFVNIHYAQYNNYYNIIDFIHRSTPFTIILVFLNISTYIDYTLRRVKIVCIII